MGSCVPQCLESFDLSVYLSLYLYLYIDLSIYIYLL